MAVDGHDDDDDDEEDDRAQIESSNFQGYDGGED